MISIFLYFTFVRAEAIRLATFKVPKFVESPNSGGFVNLATAIAKKIDRQIDFELFPPARATTLFGNGKIAGVFPALEILVSKPHYRSEAFYIKQDYLFYRSDKPVKSLSGSKLCLVQGYPYSKDILGRTDIEFAYAKSDENCMKMLSLGRVDGMISEKETGLATKEHLKAEVITYDKSQMISAQEVYFAFERTPNGKDLADKFSKAIRFLKKTDQLNKLINSQ